jgi:SAM-dependent methyltransferase
MKADPHYFTEAAVKEWTRIGEKHRLRDERFLSALSLYFRPGPVLELGAATGQLSAILHARGYDVVASDVSPPFVAAIRSRGLRGEIVDATGDISAQAGRTFANVLAQNVLPLVFRDRTTFCSALTSIHAALEQNGRLVCITAHAWRDRNPERYFSPREQVEIAAESGLFRIVTTFPHQVVPPALYRSWNASFLNALDFRAARIGSVRVVWIAEKVEAGSWNQ